MAAQDLAHEEVGDIAIRAREVVNEYRGRRFVAHRERGEEHSGRPAFGARREDLRVFTRDLDVDVGDELPDLGRGQPELGGADLAEAAGRRASGAAAGADRSAR